MLPLYWSRMIVILGIETVRKVIALLN